MDKIETLKYRPIEDNYGTCYSKQSPTTHEIVDKINEIILVINKLQGDIEYLRSQEEKRKKYKVIRRYDILLLAKQNMESGKCFGLCHALSLALRTYGLVNNNYPSSYFPLYNQTQAQRFGATDRGGYWWKSSKFGILSGRRRYLNWLIRKYKNDPEILNTIERYD